jgi:hypothetical protein
LGKGALAVSEGAPAWATQFFAPTLEVLEKAFRLLESRVPPPVREPWKDSFVFRYAERTIHQAIVQKLARTISGLHAVETLLSRGLFQEQGMIQRGLDELGEDIEFLSLGLIHGEVTELHKQYLDYFYAEEFDNPSDILGSHKSRGMVRREKIRAYNNRKLGRQTHANVEKVLTKSYSGFVHAASPQIMDMVYGVATPLFDLSGETKTLRSREPARDALNYFYRALCSMAIAAKAFGDENLFSEILGRVDALEARMQARRSSYAGFSARGSN